MEIGGDTIPIYHVTYTWYTYVQHVQIDTHKEALRRVT